jgi:hypothetical protein
MRPVVALSFVVMVSLACSSDPTPSAPVDAARSDAPDDLATDRPDGGGDAASDALDASDVSDVRDASDASDAGDSSDVRDAGDVTDASFSPVADFCQRYAQALCQRRVFCRMTAESGAVCIVRETAVCVAERAPVVDHLRAGRMVYDASAVDACLSSLPEIYCNTNNLIEASPRCAAVFRPAVADGAPCSPIGPDVCATGYCPAIARACPATCLPRAAESMPCDDTRTMGAPCAAGLVCVRSVCRRALDADATCDETASACRPGLACVRVGATATCVAPRASGLACTANEQCISRLCASGFCAGGLSAGDRCSQSFQCPDGLACVQAATGDPPEFRCAMGSAAGATCDGVRRTCGVTLACSGSTAGAVCIPMYPGVGEACAGSCVPGLWCNLTGTSGRGVCARRVAVGAACNGGDPSAPCVAPAVCLDGMCRAPGAVGATCLAGFDATCAEGLFCGADGRCATRAAAGATCVDGLRTCVDGFTCEAGRCEAKRAYGAACTRPTQCLGGLCLSGVCAGFCEA